MFFQAADGIRDIGVTGVQACALPIYAAIEAMKQGAYDYLFKPLDPHQLRRVVGEALEVVRRMREPAVVAETAAEIGRASCRERVEGSVVAVSLEKEIGGETAGGGRWE